jgi:hypothetical protein
MKLMLSVIVAFVFGFGLVGLFVMMLPHPSGPLVDLVNENSRRTARFHKLNDQIARDQAVLNDYMETENKKCSAKGQLEKKALVLQLSQIGQVVCIEPPKPQPVQPVPPPPAPPTPPAVRK